MHKEAVRLGQSSGESGGYANPNDSRVSKVKRQKCSNVGISYYSVNLWVVNCWFDETFT